MGCSRLVKWIARAVPLGLRQMERRPDLVQRKRLVQLLASAADTEWGRKYRYRELLRARDPILAFQEQVPLQSYADLQPYIERVQQGEPDVLWPGKFGYFGISGGTYSTGKVVPAGEEVLAQTFRAGALMTIRYLAQTGNLDAVRGAIIPLTGRLFKSNAQPGALLGNFSGLMTHRHLMEMKRKKKTPPPWFPDTEETLFQEDWERKLDRLADVTMSCDVRYIALIPTWGLIFFRKLIDRYNAKHGATARVVHDIWPRLQIVVSGGVALAPYREMLLDIIGPPSVDLLETYGAMEAGVVAFQSSLESSAMLLNTRGSFFEFIRYEDREKSSPERFWVGNIQPGERYVPVISNANGLWTYVLGDVVEFSEVRPPLLRVLGRTSEVLNEFRESLSGDLARRASTELAEQAGTAAVGFHVTYSPADISEMPRHEWYIEFREAPADLQRFSESLDRELRASCPPYDKVRRNSGLAAPSVIAVPLGGLHRALARTGRSLDAQAKVPSMLESRRLAEAIAEELSLPAAP